MYEMTPNWIKSNEYVIIINIIIIGFNDGTLRVVGIP